MVAEALVVLHVDHAEDVLAVGRDERHVRDLPDVTGELQAVRRVLGGASGHAPTELHEQPRHGRPVRGTREPDDDLAHTSYMGHVHGRPPHFGHPSA